MAGRNQLIDQSTRQIMNQRGMVDFGLLCRCLTVSMQSRAAAVLPAVRVLPARQMV